MKNVWRKKRGNESQPMQMQMMTYGKRFSSTPGLRTGFEAPAGLKGPPMLVTKLSAVGSTSTQTRKTVLRMRR